MSMKAMGEAQRGGQGGERIAEVVMAALGEPSQRQEIHQRAIWLGCLVPATGLPTWLHSVGSSFGSQTTKKSSPSRY